MANGMQKVTVEIPAADLKRALRATGESVAQTLRRGVKLLAAQAPRGASTDTTASVVKDAGHAEHAYATRREQRGPMELKPESEPAQSGEARMTQKEAYALLRKLKGTMPGLSLEKFLRERRAGDRY